MYRKIKHKRPLIFFYQRPVQLRKRERVGLDNRRQTHKWLRQIYPASLSPSPSYLSLPTFSQSVLRFTTLHGKERSRYKDLRSHLGIQCANPSLLQTPPSFEHYLPSKVLFLISLEHHSRPNSKRNHCLCKIPVLTRWQTRESGEYRPLQKLVTWSTFG